MKLRPVFKCHGGKSYLWEWIVGHFPDGYQFMRYVEPCGGAASVLLNKDKSVHETYNDLDPDIAGIFRQIIHNRTDFLYEVQRVLYTADSFQWALDYVKGGAAHNECYRALASLIRRRMSRGGLGKNFSWSDRLRGGQPGDVNAWQTFKAVQLPQIADRLVNVQVECMPVTDMVDLFDGEMAFFYIDPPYLPETRKATKAYTFEMDADEHAALLEVCLRAQGKVIISGYASKLYDKMLATWSRYSLSVANHSGQNATKQRRTEVLWCNY